MNDGLRTFQKLECYYFNNISKMQGLYWHIETDSCTTFKVLNKGMRASRLIECTHHWLNKFAHEEIVKFKQWAPSMPLLIRGRELSEVKAYV